MTTSTKKIKLLKFGGLGCGACIGMDRAQTFERLALEFPELEIIKYDVNDANGDVPEGSKFAENYDLSDEYNVDTLPTMVFEDVESGDELHRIEGAVGYRDMVKAVKEAQAEYDAMVSRRALSKKANAARPH